MSLVHPHIAHHARVPGGKTSQEAEPVSAMSRIGSGRPTDQQPLSGPMTMTASVWSRFDALDRNRSGILRLTDLRAAAARPRSDAIGLHGSLILASTDGKALFIGQSRIQLLQRLWNAVHTVNKSPELQRDLRMALRATPGLAQALVNLDPSRAEATRAKLNALARTVEVAVQQVAATVALWDFLNAGTLPSPPTRALLDALLACGFDPAELTAADARSHEEAANARQALQAWVAQRSDDVARSLARLAQQLFPLLAGSQGNRIDPASLASLLKGAAGAESEGPAHDAARILARALLLPGRADQGSALFARLAGGGKAITMHSLRTQLDPPRTMTC